MTWNTILSKMSQEWLRSCKHATVASGESIAYITSGHKEASRAVLLIHGYPQTLFSMRHVAAGLAAAGFFVVAADYRGAGGSSIAASGYDKMTMGSDLHSLMVDVLHRNRYAILGHDIGSMVATAQAMSFRDSVEALVMMGKLPTCGFHPAQCLTQCGTSDPSRMSAAGDDLI